MPTRNPTARRNAARSPADQGVDPIVHALKMIERDVGVYAGSGSATVQKAMAALILAIPLKGNVGEWKKQIKDALFAYAGENERGHFTEVLRSGKPGVFVSATNLAGKRTIKASLVLIGVGEFLGIHHTAKDVAVTKEQLALADAVAVDGYGRLYPVKAAMRAIIEAYAFGIITSDPFFQAPSESDAPKRRARKPTRRR